MSESNIYNWGSLDVSIKKLYKGVSNSKPITATNFLPLIGINKNIKYINTRVILKAEVSPIFTIV